MANDSKDLNGLEDDRFQDKARLILRLVTDVSLLNVPLTAEVINFNAKYNLTLN